MNEIIELTGSPESAYSTFLYVVENMFTWDENGRGKLGVSIPPSSKLMSRAEQTQDSILKVIISKFVLFCFGKGHRVSP